MAQGIGVAVITSDAVETLAEFSQQQEIPYPLLCDENAQVIEAYGVLNTTLVGIHWQLLPFPGNFLLDTDGRVLRKAFTDDLRHRPSSSALVFEQFGTDAEPHLRIEHEVFEAKITLSSTQPAHGQEVSVLLECQVQEGWHLYGPEVAAPYQPLSISFDDGPEAIVSTSHFEIPNGHPLTLPALGEVLPVLENDFTILGRIRLRWSPPPTQFSELQDVIAKLQIAPGTHLLKGELRFQACSEDNCLPPDMVRFEIPIHIQPDLPR